MLKKRFILLLVVLFALFSACTNPFLEKILAPLFPEEEEKATATPVTPIQTPVAADFDIGNLTQTVASITAVTITPKTGKSSGTITVYFNGSTTAPSTKGTYAVTFDVAAATGWNAASGLSAGTLTIVDRFFDNVATIGDWDAAVNTIKTGGNDKTSIINLTADLIVPPSTASDPTFGNSFGTTVTITGNHTLTLQSGSQGRLLDITYQDVILQDVKLVGHANNNSSVVSIINGSLTMQGNASISGNTSNNETGGVFIFGGSFIMKDNASVHGNKTIVVTGGGNCGGVGMVAGNFIMQDNASVYGNIAENLGGGVYVGSGTFTMNGGTIHDNTAGDSGGGVYLYTSGTNTFTLNLPATTGSVYGNTAATTPKDVYNDGGTINGTANPPANGW